MSRAVQGVRIAAVASVVGLVLVLAGVGAVATVSELQGTWTWYLRMEKAITASTPLALGLLAATLVTLFGVAVTADR